MSELFDEEDSVEDSPSLDTRIDPAALANNIIPDARRRLEKMMEDKRLRDELDDFIDF